MNNKMLKKVKASAGQFHSEVKSNSLTDFISWLDCKIELEKEYESVINKCR